MKLGKPVNSGVGGDNTEHKGSGYYQTQTSPSGGVRHCARTLRRPVLDRSTSVALVCAPERLRLSAQWATYGIILLYSHL